MLRIFVDDVTGTDPRSLLNTARLSALVEAVTPRDKYLECNGDATVAVDADCIFSVGGYLFKTVQTTLSAANLDLGSFVIGNDYYIYLCDPGSLQDGVIRISLNSTFPNGFTASNSRKIGGFHFGMCRRVNPQSLVPINAGGVDRGAGWEGNVYLGIIPRSVWTLKHRPNCNPEGMVHLKGTTWVDIYLSSDNGAGGLRSRYNAVPMTGTEGMTQYLFNERALVVGKRLMSYDEFCQAAFGSPQGAASGNTMAWTNASARNPAGLVNNATSSIGCRDCVGNVWEWMRDIFENFWNPTAGAWHDAMPGQDVGQIWMHNPTALRALLAGGNWSGLARAGARAAVVNNWPWQVNADVGVRLACD